MTVEKFTDAGGNHGSGAQPDDDRADAEHGPPDNGIHRRTGEYERAGKMPLAGTE
ncbi:MAG: hypothetical protein WB504_12795 [Pseudolabrys sp.]